MIKSKETSNGFKGSIKNISSNKEKLKEPNSDASDFTISLSPFLLKNKSQIKGSRSGKDKLLNTDTRTKGPGDLSLDDRLKKYEAVISQLQKKNYELAKSHSLLKISNLELTQRIIKFKEAHLQLKTQIEEQDQNIKLLTAKVSKYRSKIIKLKDIKFATQDAIKGHLDAIIDLLNQGNGFEKGLESDKKLETQYSLDSLDSLPIMISNSTELDLVEIENKKPKEAKSLPDQTYNVVIKESESLIDENNDKHDEIKEDTSSTIINLRKLRRLDYSMPKGKYWAKKPNKRFKK